MNARVLDIRSTSAGMDIRRSRAALRLVQAKPQRRLWRVRLLEAAYDACPILVTLALLGVTYWFLSAGLMQIL